MPETEASRFDVQQLRRGLVDLAALTAMPVVWTGSDPRRIAESLADALLHMLHLDLVYILVRDRAYHSPVEVAHTPEGPAPSAQAEAIGRALAPRLDTHDLSETPSSIANPLGNGMTRIVCPPLGIEARGGVLVACSPRADFPTEVDRLLLGVAANQVAILLDRRRTEDALRESEERSRGTFENAGVGIADCDVHGRFLRVNQKLCETVGYTGEELLQKTWQDITHPDDLATSLEQFVRLLRGEQPGYSLEKRLVRKDGSLVWINQAISLGREAAGTPAYVIAILQDISERKRLEEELRQAHARLDLAVRGSHVGAWEVEVSEGASHPVRRHYMNVWEQLGYEGPPDGRESVLEEAHPDDRVRAEELLRACVAGETTEFEMEVRLRHKDGSYHTILTRGAAMRDAARKSSRFLGVGIDITRLKRAEEALRESERRFRTFVDHATDAFFLFDDRLVVVDVNRQACESLGYTRDELVGMAPLDFDPDVTPAMLEEFGRRLDTGEVLVFESRHRRKDGPVFPVEVRGRPFWEGGRRFTVSLARDMTEHKRAEEALRESERRFRTLAEALPLMVWTAEPDGSLDYVNSRTIEYTGLSLDQLRGWGWQSTYDPEDLHRLVELRTRGIATGELFEMDYRQRRADGAFRWQLNRTIAVRDDSGQIIKWVGFGIDIEDQKRAQEALREAAEAAEAANRAKDDFLANVSHEIRTPMNAILGMTELVLDTPLTGDQRRYVKTVKSAADSLLGLMNDLLDFSKIEAGKLELDPADFSLRAATGDTLHALAVGAHRKGLELIYDVQPDVPDALVGDAGRLRQVLLNLVGNAINFTDAGEVVVRVEATGEATPDGEVGLRFTVRDTGIGIPADQQERIFRAFEQEDASTTRRYGGTGLGLTIAAQLVALMGGEITVASERGRGSTFAFTARFGLQPHPTEQHPVRPPVLLHGLPVLVVDDNATNRQILEEWLRGWQMQPAAVGGGLAALDALWDAVSAGRPYALVLLDARMPDTDGPALAAKIRKRAELAATRIILLTSGERPGDWDRIRERTIDAQLLKPVRQDELLEAIYRVMSRAAGKPAAPQPAAAETTTPAPAATPLRILMAEDHEFNVEYLEGLLTRRGHEVRLADNGREALALLGIRGEGSGAGPSPTRGASSLTPATDPGPLTRAFDLLLLDIQMPELDGFQVVRAIRERERTAGGHLPVIALTARSRNEDRERCLAAGMDEYLAKPVRPAELLAAIERVTCGRSVPRSIRPEAPGGTRLLDPIVLLAVCGDEAEALGEICSGLRSSLPGRLAEIGEALRTGDAPRLRVAAHKLCGLLPAFSTAAGAVASDLEDLAAGGRLDECRPLAEQLEAMAEELLRVVAGLSIEALRQQAAGP